MTPEQQYLNDPHFHRLVDLILECLEQHEMTPYVVSQAAMLACVKFEITKSIKYQDADNV